MTEQTTLELELKSLETQIAELTSQHEKKAASYTKQFAKYKYGETVMIPEYGDVGSKYLRAMIGDAYYDLKLSCIVYKAHLMDKFGKVDTTASRKVPENKIQGTGV